MLVATMDQGNRFLRAQVAEARPLILIHHWGASQSVLVDRGPQGDHVPGHDITTPPPRHDAIIAPLHPSLRHEAVTLPPHCHGGTRQRREHVG